MHEISSNLQLHCRKIWVLEVLLGVSEYSLLLLKPSYIHKNTSVWSLPVKDTDPMQDNVYGICVLMQQQIILSMILVFLESLLLYKDFNVILRMQNRQALFAKICIEECFIYNMYFKSAMARSGFDFEEESFWIINHELLYLEENNYRLDIAASNEIHGVSDYWKNKATC